MWITHTYLMLLTKNLKTIMWTVKLKTIYGASVDI